MATELVVRCQCGGFEVRGSEAEIIPAIHQHGRDVHNMEVTDEQVLAMAIPADPLDPAT
jgi:predicted small metal-binding protein